MTEPQCLHCPQACVLLLHAALTMSTGNEQATSNDSSS